MLTPRYPSPATPDDPKSKAAAGVAKEMFEAYTAALAYLEKNSPTAKALIKALRADPTKIDVAICTAGSEPKPKKYFSSMFGFEDDGTPTVQWNPGYQLVVTAGQKGNQSAALGLLHELGHAKQWLEDRETYMKHYNAALKGSEKDQLIIEDDNTDRHETKVAKELGEPWRKKYRDFGDTAGFSDKDAKLTWTEKVVLHK